MQVKKLLSNRAGKQALIMVDFQNDFVDGIIPLSLLSIFGDDESRWMEEPRRLQLNQCSSEIFFWSPGGSSWINEVPSFFLVYLVAPPPLFSLLYPGSLKVEGGLDAVKKTNTIRDKFSQDLIFLTRDWHPPDHM